MRLTTDLFAYCADRIPALEHDLDLRLPHPRGGLDRGAGARLHARERHRLLRGGGRRRPVRRRVRRAALLLLQRAQRLLPGGGEVPRGPPPLGLDHARPVRRDEPEGAGAPLPRADRRLDPDGAAAREQHRPGGRSRRSRPCWAAPSRSTRTASTRRSRSRPSDRRAIALRTQQVLMHEAGTTDTADPLGGVVVRRVADRASSRSARAS